MATLFTSTSSANSVTAGNRKYDSRRRDNAMSTCNYCREEIAKTRYATEVAGLCAPCWLRERVLNTNYRLLAAKICDGMDTVTLDPDQVVDLTFRLVETQKDLSLSLAFRRATIELSSREHNLLVWFDPAS